MAKITKLAKQNPKLEQRVLSDGRISLRLVYYHGRKQTPVLNEQGEQVFYESGKMKGKPKFRVEHNRTKESLNLYLWERPRSAKERQHNKETLELAERIRYEKEQQFRESLTGYRLKPNKSINFLDYFQAYIDQYTKKDIRMIEMALNRFKDFLNSNKKYSIYGDYVKPEQLNKDMMIDFVAYLKSRSKGEGAKSVYQRFKKVINYAIEHGIMVSNPCKGVAIVIDEHVLRKDILSLSDIEQLVNTHYKDENTNVRNAFIFCLYTGLRFCDVKDLTYGDIDYSNMLLKFEQNKTEGHSKRSCVIIPLNEGLLALVGNPKSNKPENESIFNLPTHESCNKSINRWVKRAGINKHITWHCARHSFAVNILNNGANIKTVGSLLGHAGLRHTEKYTRAVDELKKEAINSLPRLNF